MGPSLHHYVRASREFDAGTVDRGLWAIATTQNAGDAVRAAALYLRLRAEALAREELALSVGSPTSKV